MGYKYLGDHFDIHTGGIDHIPVHHENEIAQSEGFSGKIPANFWMHCNFLTVDGQKMAKSLGNLYTLDELKAKGYDPEVYRMFNFSSNYRTAINFTFEAMDAAKNTLEKLRKSYIEHKNGTEKVAKETIDDLEKRFNQAINDDLNMPVAMAVVYEVIKAPVKSKDYSDLLEKFDTVLGFNLKDYVPEKEELPDEVKSLIEKRNEARKNKDWSESDRLRDELINMGYQVKDTPNGTEVSK